MVTPMQAIELHTQITPSHEIHLRLPSHIKAGNAKVIVMYDAQDTEPQPQKRVFGQFRHQIHIAQDFDDELEADFWLGESK